jgi:hypothetical protein
VARKADLVIACKFREAHYFSNLGAGAASLFSEERLPLHDAEGSIVKATHLAVGDINGDGTEVGTAARLPALAAYPVTLLLQVTWISSLPFRTGLSRPVSTGCHTRCTSTGARTSHGWSSPP